MAIRRLRSCCSSAQSFANHDAMSDPDPPPGFLYRPDVLDEVEERALVSTLETLPFRPVRMHSVDSRRGVVHYGLDYAYEARSVTPGEPLPPLIAALRDRVAGQVG